MSSEETAVVICGGGPTGALLCAILGQMNVPAVVLEKEPDITTDPRGIALDEDGIRTLQSIGIYNKIYTEIGTSMKIFNFVTGTGHDLMKKPMIRLDYATTEGGTGHVGFICHKQPVLERAIRDVIEACPVTELRTNSVVTAISEDHDRVTVTYVDQAGQERRIRASFLVGADGKTGFVRKKYLEPQGILMERAEQTAYDETWVALNWKISLPSPKTHPQFPLWQLGYTPEQVYDVFFPEEFRFLCNPRRPAVCGRFGLPRDRLWRFEYVVHHDEDGHEMAKPEQFKKIIYPYITHPGSKYGLTQPVQYPDDCIQCLRSRPFNFSARSCNKWALGRVILAGDAAHVFPPFGGQGIASGFRDASALAWRLALLHRYSDIDHVRLLEAWYTERKQQLERSLAATVMNGEYVTESNPLKVFWREWYLWAVQLVPSWRRELEKGPRAAGMARYQHKNGLPFLPEMGGGVLLPQVYAAVSNDGKGVRFTDDLIFSKSKQGIFQLLVLCNTVEESAQLLAQARQMANRFQDYLSPEEITVLVQSTDRRLPLVGDSKGNNLARLATAQEFALDPVLCRNRPEPRYYDPYQLRNEVRGKPFAIVRPDRFVYAACANQRELEKALSTLPQALHVESHN